MKALKLVGKQGGFSSLCFMSNLVMLAFLGYIGIKLVPAYLDYRVISNAVEEVSRMSNVDTMSRQKVIGRIGESVHRNSGVSAPKLKLNDVIYVASRDGKKIVGTNYEVVVKLFYNVNALLQFEYEEVIDPYK